MARDNSTRWTSIGEEPATTSAGCGGGVPREHAGAQVGGGRDLLHDRSSELAGGEAQVLFPADSIGTGVEMGGDAVGVLGVVGVERVCGQVVR